MSPLVSSLLLGLVLELAVKFDIDNNGSSGKTSTTLLSLCHLLTQPTAYYESLPQALQQNHRFFQDYKSSFHPKNLLHSDMRCCYLKWENFCNAPFVDTTVLGEEFDINRNNPNTSIQEDYQELAVSLHRHIENCLGETGPRGHPLFAARLEEDEKEGKEEVGRYEDVIEYRLPTLYLHQSELNKIGTLQKITQNCWLILFAIEEKVTDLQNGIRNGTASRRQDTSLRKLYHSMGCYQTIIQIVMQVVDLVLRKGATGGAAAASTQKFITRLQTFTERFANKIKENEWADVMKLFVPVMKDIQQHLI